VAALGVFALGQALHLAPAPAAAAKCGLLAGFPVLLWALGVLSRDEIATLDSLRRSGVAMTRRLLGVRQIS
jgi:hypothetical protein